MVSAVSTGARPWRRVGLLPAAGRAVRLGIDSPKELLHCHGRPVIDHSVAHLVDAGVADIVVVTRPGKEVLVDHLRSAWPSLHWEFVVQPEPIGRLIDALRVAAPALAGAVVHLLFPDTCVAPNPFRAPLGGGAVDAELVLLCHDAADGERWRHFGVVDPVRRRVVEKPTEPLGSTLCWGAAVWQPTFTGRLAEAADLTEAINRAAWRHALAIDCYADVGLGPLPAGAVVPGSGAGDGPGDGQAGERGPAASATARAASSSASPAT
jgi:hypothetical protein